MTREQAITGLAMQMAMRNGYQWQKHPDGRQSRKQSAYIREALAAVLFIENAMDNYVWKA